MDSVVLVLVAVGGDSAVDAVALPSIDHPRGSGKQEQSRFRLQTVPSFGTLDIHDDVDVLAWLLFPGLDHSPGS